MHKLGHRVIKVWSQTIGAHEVELLEVLTGSEYHFSSDRVKVQQIRKGTVLYDLNIVHWDFEPIFINNKSKE